MTWQNIANSLRGTGRTTRMINAVCSFVVAGRPCVIVAANYAHGKQLAEMLPEDVRPMVQIITWDSRRWNPVALEVRGVPKDAGVFVDHFALEQHSSRIFEAMHAWDAAPLNLPAPMMEGFWADPNE